MLSETSCDFIAGCVGGACGVLVGHPFDTIKTWQQKLNATVGRSVYEIISRHHGYSFNGFYRGMQVPLVTNGAINSVIYAVYGHHLRQLEYDLNGNKEAKKRLRNKNVFLAGMVAGFIQAYLICPIELIKIRLQTMAFRGSPIACARDIFRREGLNGFYRGITPTLWRDVLPYGIYMATYDVLLDMIEHCMDVHKRETVFKSANNGVIAFAGSIAGVMSWIFVVPFDVIKTKMQSETDPRKHPTMWDSGLEVFRTGGVRALIRGTKMILLRSMPVNALTFVGFEHTLSVLHYFFLDKEGTKTDNQTHMLNV